jgi:hypothetical protein
MTRPLAATLAGLLVLAPLGAAAQCLDQSALSRGITVRYESGDFATMRRGADGYVTVEEHYVNGDPTMRLRAHRGIFFVDEVQIDANGQPVPDTRLSVEYPVDPATIEDPAAGSGWEGQTLNRFADGYTRPEKTSLLFSEGDGLDVAGCSYDALVADVRYDWGQEGGLTLQYLYLPELGTAVLLSSHFDGGDQRVTTPVAIEAQVK